MYSSSVNNLLEDNLNESIDIPKSNSHVCIIQQKDVIFTNKNGNNNSIGKQYDTQRNRTSSFTLGSHHHNYSNNKLNIPNHINPEQQQQPNIRCNNTTGSITTTTTTPINILAQRHLVMEMLQESSITAATATTSPTTNLPINQFSISEFGDSKLTISSCNNNYGRKRNNRKIANDNLSTILSTFYAKFIIVLGIAFPVTDILSIKAPPSFYQGFYLYLYLVSVTFVIFVFVTHLRQRRLTKIESYRNKFNINSNTISEKNEKYLEGDQDRRSSNVSITKKFTTSTMNIIRKNFNSNKSLEQQTNVRRYGSFYLRIGAVGFGIGSMVYSGLEFGQYFELKSEERCQNALIILNPAARILLTIVQMQFIYLNTKDLGLNQNKFISRFGLMHMIATNICEWLYVLVEETKHEIINIAHNDIDTILNNNNNYYNENKTILYQQNQQHHHIIMKRATSLEIVVECRRTNIMGLLVQNASPFLFPCTIEYSLICAVTLFEMWKTIQKWHTNNNNNNYKKNKNNNINLNQFNKKQLNNNNKNIHQLSIDCTKSQNGLFLGILVISLTIISLVIYFAMSNDPIYNIIGIFGITISEFILYILGTISSFIAMYQMRDLRHCKNIKNFKISFDCQLLIVTQSGIFIYSMFSIIGSYFLILDNNNNDINQISLISLITEILSLIQTSIQTLFILNVWWRKCQSSQEIRKKPGKDLVTFLLIINISLWLINSLIKSRAVFRPNHLIFFGQWAWIIITHISIPLSIFYRVHSTICLFEIWKNTFKNKNSLN